MIFNAAAYTLTTTVRIWTRAREMEMSGRTLEERAQEIRSAIQESPRVSDCIAQYFTTVKKLVSLVSSEGADEY